MRKIVSKQEADKKKKRNQLIVGGVLISVMFLSVLGYAFQNNSITNSSSGGNQTITYNGSTFTNENGFWVLQKDNENLTFSYNPTEISVSNTTGFAALTKTISDYQGKPLYIYYNNSDQVSSDAGSELGYNMKNFANGVHGENLNSSSPNCAFNTIIIQNGSQNINENGNCVYISGQGEELIKLVDGVLFKILGI